MERRRDVKCYPEFSQLGSVMARFTHQVCLVSKPAPFSVSLCQLVWFIFSNIMGFLIFYLPASSFSVTRMFIDYPLFLSYRSSLYDKKQQQQKHSMETFVWCWERENINTVFLFHWFQKWQALLTFLLHKHSRKEHIEDCFFTFISYNWSWAQFEEEPLVFVTIILILTLEIWNLSLKEINFWDHKLSEKILGQNFRLTSSFLHLFLQFKHGVS